MSDSRTANSGNRRPEDFFIFVGVAACGCENAASLDRGQMEDEIIMEALRTGRTVHRRRNDPPLVLQSCAKCDPRKRAVV